MARRYIFADESGNFDFSRKPGASKYFILTTVTMESFAAGDALLQLRREMAWDGLGLASEFHAATDAQAVRDRVFSALLPFAFRIDATILEKSKAFPRSRSTDEQFYRSAWFLHLKQLAQRVAAEGDELLIVGAALGTKKKRQSLHAAVAGVVQQVLPSMRCCIASWTAESDPCLQVADYCSWAIQRKCERGDDRSYRVIRDKIASESDCFRRRRTHYY
ncbi:MAG TPA: DUF3800 domain-containing protein [Longimicrobiaceae bacterium]|nr:DUF3800 domain-containing protein [Longimicrobiaceae bacterium]